MKKFIAKSDVTKKLLNIAQVSSNLPVNIIITGEIGVGKKLLAQEVLPDATLIDAKTLESMLINNSANIEQYKELIVTNIDNVINKDEFFAKLNGVKLVVTARNISKSIEELFAVKIDIPSLKERPEDLEELTKVYLEEARDIYDTDATIGESQFDLSQNGLSLKKSIFKNLHIASMNDDDIILSLRQFITRKLKQNLSYKDILKYFEVALLNSAKIQFKSQLQMATKLKINRITLRKKLDQYSKDII